MYNWHSTWNGQAALADDNRLAALRDRKFAATLNADPTRQQRVLGHAAKMDREAEEIEGRIGYRQ